MMKKIPFYWKTLIFLILLTGLMALSRFSSAFCDWYNENLYPYLCDGISRVTGPVPFAVGEIIMYLCGAMLVFGILFAVILAFKRKSIKYRKFCAGYFKTLLMALVFIVFIYMPAWYMPFCGTVLGRGDIEMKREYTFEDLKAVTRYAVEGINAAAEEIVTEPDGTVEFPDENEARILITDAMHRISDRYTRLNGYYPPVKTALCSDILERMCIGGYNYPFTMEPTKNKYTGPMCSYSLQAHEYCHHKGFEKENEANFLSELALSESEDPFMRLSAFWDMYSWVYKDYCDEASKVINEMLETGEVVIPFEKDTKEYYHFYLKVFGQINDIPGISKRADMIYNESFEIKTEIYEADCHPIDEMPKVETVIEEVSDTGWEVQGEILKENSYDGVTLLWLNYFDEMKR